MDDNPTVYNRSLPPLYSEPDSEYQRLGHVPDIPHTSCVQNASIRFITPSVDKDQQFITSYVPKKRGRAVIGTGAFHWNIDCCDSLAERTESMVFSAADQQWQIILSHHRDSTWDTVYLHLRHVVPTSAYDSGVYASFALVISNAKDPSIMVANKTSNAFSADKPSHGLSYAADCRGLSTRSLGTNTPILENGRLRVSAYIRVYMQQQSPKQHVCTQPIPQNSPGGLISDEHSPYLAPLLLSLFYIPQFRSAVDRIHINTDRGEQPIVSATKEMFQSLLTSKWLPSTAALSSALQKQPYRSIWTSTIGHYIRLYNEYLGQRVVGKIAECSLNELAMVESTDSNIIDGLFMRRQTTFTTFRTGSSTILRTNSTYALAITIHGSSTIPQAVKRYCEPYSFGDRSPYSGAGPDYCCLEETIRFDHLPPVLHIHLNRFERNEHTGVVSKNHNWIQFTKNLDMSQFMSRDADADNPWTYTLHGVLLHIGDMANGRYAALLHAPTNPEWCCFDNNLTFAVSEKFVVDKSNEITDSSLLTDPRVCEHVQSSRFDNAYMLVYIRTCMLDAVFGDKPEMIPPVPAHTICSEFPRVQQYYGPPPLKVYIIDESQFRKHQGLDLCNHPCIGGNAGNGMLEVSVPPDTPIQQFTELVAASISLATADFRFWSMARRVNNTLRCVAPVNPLAHTTIGHLMDASECGYESLYLYCERRAHSSPLYFSQLQLPDNIAMIHVKLYNHLENTITGLGHIYVDIKSRVTSIYPTVWHKAQLPGKTGLNVYWEIGPRHIKGISGDIKFRSVGIRTGDIICFQVNTISPMPGRDGTVCNYFESYVNNLF